MPRGNPDFGEDLAVPARLPTLAVLVLVLLFGAPGVASACSIVVTDHSTSARRADAQRTVGQATAIVDGEVIRPLIRGQQNALVRAHRVLRGPPAETFEVGEQTSCDIALTNQGERLRLLLVGGPDVYFLRVDNSNARYEDEILESDRSVDWPYYVGEQPR